MRATQVNATSNSSSWTARRTGSIGRMARLALLVVSVASLLSAVGPRGSAQFRNPLILSELLAWFLHTAMFVTFVTPVGALASSLAGPRVGRRWQIGAVVVSVAAVKRGCDRRRDRRCCLGISTGRSGLVVRRSQPGPVDRGGGLGGGTRDPELRDWSLV